MKQLLTINKKMILTASLLAVLGTQYSYQSSSLDFKSASSVKNYGEFVLASTSGDNTTVDKQAHEDKKATEAVNPTECKDCKTIVLSPTTTLKLSLEDYTKLLTQIQLDVAKTTPTPAATVAQQSDSDCEPARADETRSERRDRIQCEKEEKAQIKKDKEDEKKQARLEKFEDKMDALKDKCSDDLECLSSGFTSILSRYEGKNALPATTVTKAFNTVVGVPLKNALASNDPAVLVNAQSLLQDMPEQYKALKQSVILAVKAQATVSANKVSAEYAAVNELSKQNKPQEYFEALATTQQDHRDLNNLVMGYSVSIEQSLELANDKTTFAFYQKSYVPDMKKIMTGIISGVPADVKKIEPTNNTRDGRNGTSSTTLPENEKMTRDNSQWTLPTGTQGLQIGTPSTQSRGGRGPNQ